MKNYTDLEQSKKLADILPIESADTHSWSLATLLNYLSANFHVDIKCLDNYWELDCRVQVTYNKELVDACYEMIIKLYDKKLL